jgi:hypothetical protein
LLGIGRFSGLDPAPGRLKPPDFWLIDRGG